MRYRKVLAESPDHENPFKQAIKRSMTIQVVLRRMR